MEWIIAAVIILGIAIALTPTESPPWQIDEDIDREFDINKLNDK